MNARETHIVKEQEKRDAQQRKADVLPAPCACGNKTKARNMCSACYSKWLRQNNPEYYERQKNGKRKYHKEHPEKVKEWNKRWADKNPEAIKRYHKNYMDKHPDKKEQCLQNLDEFDINRVCLLLKKHAEDMKNDPEHLTTEYILNMSKLKEV